MAPHLGNGASAAERGNALGDTRSSDTARAWGVSSDERAKTLGKTVPRGAPNPHLQMLRGRAQRVFIARYAGEKRGVSWFSRMVGATRNVIAKWFNPKEVDQHPIPVAVLWAVDDEEFESLYVVIRADRRAMREGR